jgi:hypothetical protein
MTGTRLSHQNSANKVLSTLGIGRKPVERSPVAPARSSPGKIRGRIVFRNQRVPARDVQGSFRASAKRIRTLVRTCRMNKPNA